MGNSPDATSHRPAVHFSSTDYRTKEEDMTEATMAKMRAAMVAIGPAFLLAALVYHPWIADLRDTTAVAAAASEDTTRWALAHIAVGLGFALLLNAFLAVRRHLREAGEDRWSASAVPLLVLGTVLFTFLPAMEVAMVAAVRAGANAVEVQDQLGTWFVPMMMSGAVTFAAGVILTAVGVVRSGVLGPELGRIVVGALIVVAVTRFVPLGAALHTGTVAALIALVPLAIQMWSGAAEGTARGRSILATSRGGAR
jgi:hypothetical protein